MSSETAPGAGRPDGPADSPADGDGPTYMHIGEVAARTELSLRSLRHWEEVGLLQPSGRTAGGFRLYTEDDVATILVIRRMKPLGFSLEQMKDVLSDIETLQDDDAPHPQRRAAGERLAGIREQAVERRATLVRQVGMADELLGILDERT